MADPSTTSMNLIFWGRSDHKYSRNGVVRKVMQGQGWQIHDHAPGLLDQIGLGGASSLPADAGLVWVPCFRQRDMATARRFADKRGLPLIFDPLISAYDKQVFERCKFAEASAKARKLLDWERKVFGLADLVIADTQAHADYFHEVLEVPRKRLAVLAVGADENLFQATPLPPLEGRRPRVVFFGSFIELQGPEVIADAATLCPEVDWHLLGDGPMLDQATAAAKGMEHIHFEPYPGYTALPEHIAKADIAMGVFSDSSKAGRVIANKIWQSLASGRPVISREVEQGAFPWPEDPSGKASGVITVAPRDPQALADAVKQLLAEPAQLSVLGQAARKTFEAHGSFDCIKRAFTSALERAGVQTQNQD